MAIRTMRWLLFWAAALTDPTAASFSRGGLPFGMVKFLSGPQVTTLKRQLRPLLASSPELVRLVSWLSSDMLALQTLAALSGAGGIAATAYTGKNPPRLRAALRGPCRWQALFLAINTGQVLRLALERRPIRLSDVEARTHALLFGAGHNRHGMSPIEFRRFAKQTGMARVLAPPGTRLTREGCVDNHLDLLLSGRCVVRRSGATLGELRAGAFVGEISFVAEEQREEAVVAEAQPPQTWAQRIAAAARGGAPDPAAVSTATVVCAQPGVELVRWKNDKLHDYLDSNPEHAAILERLFAQDLARKVSSFTELK